MQLVMEYPAILVIRNYDRLSFLVQLMTYGPVGFGGGSQQGSRKLSAIIILSLHTSQYMEELFSLILSEVGKVLVLVTVVNYG